MPPSNNRSSYTETEKPKTPKEHQPEEERRILTVRELAEFLQVDVSTIYRLVWTKELPAFRVGRDWRFKLDEIENWMLERQKRTRSGQTR